MKIGFIIYGDPETMTGGFLYDRMLIGYLREHGDTVEIISLPWRSYWRTLFDNTSAVVEKAVERLRPDLIIEDELCHSSLFAINRKIKSNFHCPIIAVVHHLRCCEHRPEWINMFYRTLEKKFLSSVDGYIFNSHSTYDAVTARIHDEKPYVIALPGGDRFGTTISEQAIATRALKPGPLEIIFVGALIPRKGLRYLITSLSFLEAGSWRLTAVGSLETDKRYVKRIRKQIAASGLEERVSLLGEISDCDLEDRMWQSHVLVVPSFIEGFGIVYLEGMGFGLPAIACDAAGAAEIIKHGSNGYLVSFGDNGAMDRHLGELAQNRKRLADMGISALKTYLKYQTWKDTGKSISKYLHTFRGPVPAS